MVTKPTILIKSDPALSQPTTDHKPIAACAASSLSRSDHAAPYLVQSTSSTCT
jgi:hypothetical protein